MRKRFLPALCILLLLPLLLTSCRQIEDTNGPDDISLCTLTEEEVNDFCTALPRYKRPRKIIFEDVPRNPTGKIEKPKLRERYSAGRLVEKATTN